MKPDHISVLVSHPGHFEVVAIKRDIDELQQLVGGYVESVPRPSPETPWFAYCNEDGKSMELGLNRASTFFIDQLYTQAGLRPFTSFDQLVGPIVWLGRGDEEEDSVPIDIVQGYAMAHLRTAWSRSSPITMVRHRNDVWVWDSIQGGPIIPHMIAALTTAARLSDDHGIVEVYAGVDRAKWVEVRVELMDHPEMDLHDERDDRTYG